MALERTLAIIKPDAVAKNFIGEILAQIEENGLHIIASKMTHLSKEEAEEFYSEHSKRPFYNSLVKYMSSGPVMVQVFEGENAIEALRNIMGATKPIEAKKGTIRNLYANHEPVNGTYENAIHGSDSIQSAGREINFFFTNSEINKQI
jgi:nucleoside-diphosphate kinase|tara:strand:+ start:962 stop:1405 length:444 start_codon:yes stop_codon:yes gene_type:complete